MAKKEQSLSLACLSHTAETTRLELSDSNALRSSASGSGVRVRVRVRVRVSVRARQDRGCASLIAKG